MVQCRTMPPPPSPEFLPSPLLGAEIPQTGRDTMAAPASPPFNRDTPPRLKAHPRRNRNPQLLSPTPPHLQLSTQAGPQPQPRPPEASTRSHTSSRSGHRPMVEANAAVQ